MSRNIFYASNTQSELFPYNTRTQFNQYIDVHNLYYIKQDDIEVAIKSIAFDNTQSIHLLPNIKQPHFMIVQEITMEEPYKQVMRTILNNKGEKSGVKKSLRSVKTIEGFININESMDYAIINNCEAKRIIVQSHEDRGFSNILFIYNNCIIHHIYMHYMECFYLDTFINHINSVLKSITFYHDNAKIETDLLQKEYELHALPFKILVHEYIAETLGIYTEKKTSIKLLDYFSDMQDCTKDSPATLFMNDVYKFEQRIMYYEVNTTISPLKVHPRLFQATLYGIRSNISEPTIRSAAYDTLVGLFQDHSKHDMLNIEFRNPPFFKTRKELLSRAQFDIIDLDSSKNNQTPSIGSPTYIHTIVREAPKTMKRPFTIFLDSSCPISKQLYPDNTNTDFIIELPERLNFRRNWTVTLKILFLSNKIQNIEDCHVQYRSLNPTDYIVQEKAFTLKNGNYGTLASFIHEISEEFKRTSMPFTIDEVENGRVKIKIKGKVRKGYKSELRLSKYLASILGYTSSPKQYQALRFDHDPEYIAPHNPNLFLVYPKNLIVGCNIVDDTIFGGQTVKLLRLITNSDNLKSDILTFEFQQDEKVMLGIREFKSIHISIMDATGLPVKSESNFPSRLQLMFSLE
jgi:hypothetical protein